jgi:hypothetical protein
VQCRGRIEWEMDWRCDGAGMKKRNKHAEEQIFCDCQDAYSWGGKGELGGPCQACQTTHEAICETVVEMGVVGRTDR